MGFKDDNTQSRTCNHHPETCTCRDEQNEDVNKNKMNESVKDKSCWMVREKTIQDYIKVCEEASLYDEVFDSFKSDPRYTAILEHTKYQVASNYLKQIQQHRPFLLANPAFLNNDKIGGAKIQHFELENGYIRASTSTIQYIGVLCNLIRKFGSLHDFKIAEIGGGYGGQCKIIQDQFNISRYDIFDLPSVNLLQEKYLKKLDKFELVNVFPDPSFISHNYDLVISNYALSEILEPLQTEYAEKLLLGSTHGYITCNVEIKALDQLKEQFPTLEISPDIEGERKDNFIITW